MDGENDQTGIKDAADIAALCALLGRKEEISKKRRALEKKERKIDKKMHDLMNKIASACMESDIERVLGKGKVE